MYVSEQNMSRADKLEKMRETERGREMERERIQHWTKIAVISQATEMLRNFIDKYIN